MRARQAARRTSNFIKPSGLGKADPGPVIEEVAIQRGNIRPKIIVKDGMISQSNFNYHVGERVTVHAKLSGRGYFYGTFQYQQNQFLAFVTPVTRSLSYSFILEKPLNNLNFHIGHTIPTDLNPTYLDVKSRQLLRNNPNTYESLGFIPNEAVVKDSVSDTEWGGKISEHSYTRHGINTAAKTRGENVRYVQNLDGGWLGASALYVYDGSSWSTPKGSGTAVLQVGQPHCIVTKLVGYKNTVGVGGEYHPYADYPRDLPPSWNISAQAQAERAAAKEFYWSSADKIRGDRICLMNLNYVNQYARDDHKGYGEENYVIQANGGEVNQIFEGGNWFPTTNGPEYHSSNDYCAKVEWWNPETGEWSHPAVHPPWEAKITQDGKFAFYFRFPRQLIESDDFYYKTPQWQIAKTYDCYPMAGNNSELRYARIGRPYHQGKTETTSLTLEFEGKTLHAQPESPLYTVMVAPEAKSDDGNVRNLDRDRQKKSYIPTMVNTTNLFSFQAADPISFSYADNPDILKAYWTNGNFTPGGSFMLLGQAMDFFGHFWVSTQPLKTKNSGPFELIEQQGDMVRGEPRPNQFTADRILNNNRFVTTDIDDPAKVSKFKPIWESVFPGVPFTKEILVAIIQGTDLPELENVSYTQLRGFLPDDPLRYETTYMGQTYRHPYTLSFCKIPEGWWGPTIEFNEAGEASGPSVVHIGNYNNYFFLKEEQVNLEEEIQYQRQLIEAGLIGAEAFAASELQNEMVDTTKEYFQNRQETLEERQDSGESPSSDDTSWFFRREPVNRGISKFTLLGAGPGQITDVTNTYSADHFTSLDGLSTKNVRQYHFNDLFVLEGANGGTLLSMPSDPKPSVPVKLTNEANFGNSSRGALMARATGLGNPMKYSTENKQDNINLGNISAKNIAPLGSPLDDLIGFDVGTVKKTVKDIAGGALLILGGMVAVKGIKTISELSTVRNRAKRTKYEAKKAKREYLESINNTRRTPT